MTIAPPQIRAPRTRSAKSKTKRRPRKVPRHTSGIRGQINAWMAEAFKVMGAPELVGKVPWNFNKRMTSARGRASCTWLDGKATDLYIEFSTSLMKLSDEEGQRQCVFHECAHIVDYHKGTYVQGRAHGPSWKSLMARAGVPAERCHKVEPLKRRKVKRWKATCGCKVHMITSQKRKKIKRGEMSYSCKKCGGILKLER